MGLEIRKGTRDRCHPYPGGRPAVVVLLLLSRTSQVFSWIHKQMDGWKNWGLKEHKRSYSDKNPEVY